MTHRPRVLARGPRRDVDGRRAALRGLADGVPRGRRAAGRRRRGHPGRRGAARRRAGHRHVLQRLAEVPVGAARAGADHAVGACTRRQSKRVARPCQSWYLDLGLHARFWDTEHIYHHTAPILNIYALREALRIIVEEGVDAAPRTARLHASRCAPAWKRSACASSPHPAHRADLGDDGPGAAGSVVGGRARDAAGRVQPGDRGGLGEYADRMWRIGIMGHSAQQANVCCSWPRWSTPSRRQGYAPPQQRRRRRRSSLRRLKHLRRRRPTQPPPSACGALTLPRAFACGGVYPAGHPLAGGAYPPVPFRLRRLPSGSLRPCAHPSAGISTASGIPGQGFSPAACLPRGHSLAGELS